MGLLQIKLNAVIEKEWADIRARPEFTFMPQIGVLSALMRCYLTHNMTPSEKSKATAASSEADTIAALRINRIKKWATLDAESRWVNRDNFIKYADPAIVAQCHGDAFQALEFEALQYE